jgi:hypothetical protein
MKTAIVFLAKSPFIETINFADEVFSKSKFDTFVVVDSPESSYSDSLFTNKSNKLILDDYFCANNGYVGCNNENTHIKKEIIAYDKFLYYFCEKLTEYDFVWVFEDDVFIPFPNTIAKLHDKYSRYDLVTPNNFHKNYAALDWHWESISKVIKPPYYSSMVCAMGISRRLLNHIKTFKDKKGRLFHIEAMFNTIAMHNGLSVFTPLELKSIVWQGEWGIDEFMLLPNNVFHPKKDIFNYPKYRKEIQEKSKSGFKPVNKLPKFITELIPFK